MPKFTSTNTSGSPIIQVHVTGCAHAVAPDRVVGQGETAEEAFSSAIELVDPDGDWPEAWKIKIVACAKKAGAK